jgi:hypothetical protein
MRTLYQKKPFIQREIKPDNIKLSELSEVKILIAEDPRSHQKIARWSTQHAGDCTLEVPTLEITPGGFFTFSGNLSSSGNDDSWGILHFDFKQANGLVLWSSGAFWSPTIGDWAPWIINSTYPEYLFDSIALVQFSSHC